MFAQLTHLQGSPEKVADAIRCYYVETIPAAGEQSGFSGGYLLADRASGHLISLTTWATEADMLAGDPALAGATETLATAAGASPGGSVERYEVLGQASGNLTARPT
jgi:heme-degrading monooxygenase HmoA